MPPGADPHEFEPSADDIATMTEADLVLANGLGFEAGLHDALDAARDAGVPVVELGAPLGPLPLDGGSHEAEQDEHGHDDEGEGGLDPHWFTDPFRMSEAIGMVRRTVEGLDGVDVDAVREDALAYANELLDVAAEIGDELSAIPVERRRLVTNHDVFGYFADRFDLEIVGTVIPGGTTLAEPSSAELADLVDLIRDTGVPAVFADTSAPEDLADALAQESGDDIAVVELYSESLGPPGSDGATYVDVLRTNAARITEALA
jgi:zinc/manganese transport system substrate-binding protein